MFGETIDWIIAAVNHTVGGYPANSVTLLTEKAIARYYGDSAEPSSPFNRESNSRRTGGSNTYAHSNIHQWLNKEELDWFVKQHPADEPPKDGNRYDNKPGFLSNVSPEFRAAVLDTVLRTQNMDVSTGIDVHTISAKFFLPGYREVGAPSNDEADNFNGSGARFPIFPALPDGTKNPARYLYPTASAIANDILPTVGSRGVGWRLRSGRNNNRQGSFGKVVMGANSTQPGMISHISVNNLTYQGIGFWLRIVCNLPNTVLVTDSPVNGYYEIVWTTAPTTPSTITVPVTVYSKQNATISWSASTDTNIPPQAITYVLEAQINRSGTWNPIYSGPLLTFNHPVTFSPIKMDHVQYRVKATNSARESEYRTSPERTVVHNSPPTINGSDNPPTEAVGAITAPFSRTYQVNDVDAGDVLTVRIRLNGTVIQTINNAVRSQNYTATFTMNQFLALGNGNHTLTVSVDDGTVTTTKTYTFSRATNKIDFTTSVNTIDEGGVNKKATKVLAILLGTIPDSYRIIQACNNGNDASPTWETIQNGKRYTFQNGTKTASNWLLKVRVQVNPPSGHTFTVQGLTGIYDLEGEGDETDVRFRQLHHPHSVFTEHDFGGSGVTWTIEQVAATVRDQWKTEGGLCYRLDNGKVYYLFSRKVDSTENTSWEQWYSTNTDGYAKVYFKAAAETMFLDHTMDDPVAGLSKLISARIGSFKTVSGAASVESYAATLRTSNAVGNVLYQRTVGNRHKAFIRSWLENGVMQQEFIGSWDNFSTLYKWVPSGSSWERDGEVQGDLATVSSILQAKLLPYNRAGKIRHEDLPDVGTSGQAFRFILQKNTPVGANYIVLGTPKNNDTQLEGSIINKGNGLPKVHMPTRMRNFLKTKFNWITVTNPATGTSVRYRTKGRLTCVDKHSGDGEWRLYVETNVFNSGNAPKVGWILQTVSNTPVMGGRNRKNSVGTMPDIRIRIRPNPSDGNKRWFCATVMGRPAPDDEIWFFRWAGTGSRDGGNHGWKHPGPFYEPSPLQNLHPTLEWKIGHIFSGRKIWLFPVDKFKDIQVYEIPGAPEPGQAGVYKYLIRLNGRSRKMLPIGFAIARGEGGCNTREVGHIHKLGVSFAQDGMRFTPPEDGMEPPYEPGDVRVRPL